MNADIPPPTVACPAPEAREAGFPIALSQARRARLDGDFGGALCLTEAVLVLEPRSADAWLELGLAHSAMGHDEPAHEALLRALKIAPDYDDARLALARLAYRSGDTEGAQQWLSGIASARLDDEETSAFRQSLTASHHSNEAWRIDGFAAYSALTSDFAPWREASLSMVRRGGADTIGAKLEIADRFGDSDTFGEVQFARSTGGATWGVALGGAPDAHFKPEAAIRIDLSASTNADWLLDASFNVARYQIGQIVRLGLRAERYLSGDLRLSAQGIVVRDETDTLRTGYGLGGAWGLGDGAEVSLAWFDAPESSEGMTIDVRSISIGVAANISTDTRVRVTTLREERDAFDRLELSLAVTRTF